MKKIAILLTVALLCVSALAETCVGGDYTLTLPAGYAAVDEAGMAGYRKAAAADTGADYEGEALLAVREGSSISLVRTETSYADVDAAVAAVIAEYAQYIDGFDSVAPTSVEAGGHTFSRLQFALDGEVASQYFLLENGTLFTLTFLGADDAEIQTTLAGFTPVAAGTADETTGPETPEITATPAA